MRKIEKDMLKAMVQRRDWRCKNTEVVVTDETVNVYLHGNRIARYWRASGVLDMTLHGRPTVTTRSRLNAICDHVGAGRWYQVSHEQFMDGMRVNSDQVVSVQTVTL